MYLELIVIIRQRVGEDFKALSSIWAGGGRGTVVTQSCRALLKMWGIQGRRLHASVVTAHSVGGQESCNQVRQSILLLEAGKSEMPQATAYVLH